MRYLAGIISTLILLGCSPAERLPVDDVNVERVEIDPTQLYAANLVYAFDNAGMPVEYDVNIGPIVTLEACIERLDKEIAQMSIDGATVSMGVCVPCDINGTPIGDPI